jgi:hypothetical protein
LASCPTREFQDTKQKLQRDRDYWIVKLNESGKFEWDKTLGGDSLDQTQSIVQAKDGGYVTVGWSQSNMSGDKTEKKWKARFLGC